MKKNRDWRGFTLIELLIVIAIIAILAVVVVLTLNPAQLLAESRDSNRISDFSTLKDAIAIYQADVSSTNMGTAATVYQAYSGTALTTATLISTTSSGWGYLSGDATAVSATSTRGVNGTSTGWLPMNFGAISSGAPFGLLPVDPLGTGTNTNCANTSPCLYTYAATSTGQYKLAAKMESSKYQNGGSSDVETGDGGNSSTTYEQGSAPNL